MTGHPFHGDPSRLDSPERQETLPALPLLTQMGIRKGDVIIDFGAGIGYFAIPALDLVGSHGTVIAIDNSPQMLDILQKRAGNRPNLTLIQGNSLDNWTADKILLIAVLHELPEPAAFLQTCFDHLKPEGHVIVIDWQKIETDHGPPVEDRISKKELLAMTTRPSREHSINSAYYFIEFS
jgi:ubiquinone/menaquinone biosynthesis C-methylase UbiE